ncbi:galactokinase [Geothrix limicola]|nr:galactokinase [Geothrix limicola]
MAKVGAARIRESFLEHFGEPELIVRGPGRVNLIGEHTDYNLGFVLPAAVDKAIWLAMSPRADGRCRFHSVDLNESCEVDLKDLARSEHHWANYLLGVITEFLADGRSLGGVDCAFGGDVPIGSGMSSSAALECGFAFGLNELFDLGYDRLALARLGQRAENRYVGVACGIMDQFASLLGREGRLIRLDCRDLSFEYAPFERSDLRVVLCDSRVRRTLAGSEYNVRRTQCETGVALLAGQYPGVKSLRDVTPAMLQAHRKELNPVVFRRCDYVVRENGRVLEACEALGRSDFEAFGALMNASHDGLRDDYEVSCAELDILVNGARTIPGVLGSRMMGAGFGGCTISLVEEGALTDFSVCMADIYRKGLGTEPRIHECRLTGGTASVE